MIRLNLDHSWIPNRDTSCSNFLALQKCPTLYKPLPNKSNWQEVHIYWWEQLSKVIRSIYEIKEIVAYTFFRVLQIQPRMRSP